MDSSSKVTTTISKWIFYISFALSIVIPLSFPLDPSFGFYGPPNLPTFLFPILSPVLNNTSNYLTCSVILYLIMALFIPQVWALEAITTLVTAISTNLGANGFTLVLIRFISMVLMSIGFIFLIRRLSASSTRRSPLRSFAIVIVAVTSLLSCISIWLTQRCTLFIDYSAKSMGLNSSLYIIDVIGRGILGASFSLLLAYLLLEFRDELKHKSFQKIFLHKLKTFSGIVLVISLINFLSILTLPLTKGVPFAAIMSVPPTIISVYLFAKIANIERSEIT